MVNTRTDAELAAAFQAAVDAMLPQILNKFVKSTEMVLCSGGNPPQHYPTWLERFNKQKPVLSRRRAVVVTTVTTIATITPGETQVTQVLDATRNRGQQSHRATNSGSKQNKAPSEVLVLLRQAGQTTAGFAKKNTEASSSGQLTRKPDASVRDYAPDSGPAANATGSLSHAPIELKELKISCKSCLERVSVIPFGLTNAPAVLWTDERIFHEFLDKFRHRHDDILYHPGKRQKWVADALSRIIQIKAAQTDEEKSGQSFRIRQQPRFILIVMAFYGTGTKFKVYQKNLHFRVLMTEAP
ncbi:hypothetical protein Tco_0533054 [Tanacetum coccineum]